MTSITWAGPRCVQEAAAILGPQNRIQGRCAPKQAHCSLRTRRGAAESGSKAAVGLLRWIGGSRGLLIINITSRVRGKVSISIYGILCKGGLRDLK